MTVVCEKDCSIPIDCGHFQIKACLDGCWGDKQIKSYLSYTLSLDPIEVTCKVDTQENSVILKAEG